CVQRAAGIGEALAALAVMMDGTLVGMVVMMLMLRVRGSGVRERQRVGARRRHDAGKLRDQEQGREQPDKPRYRPEPVHRRQTISAEELSLWSHGVPPSTPGPQASDNSGFLRTI